MKQRKPNGAFSIWNILAKMIFGKNIFRRKCPCVKKAGIFSWECTVNCNELSLSTLILLHQDKYMQCKQYLHLTIFKFDFLDFLFYLCKIQFICWLLLVYGFFLVNLNIQQKRWESYYFRSVPLICHLFSLFWP